MNMGQLVWSKPSLLTKIIVSIGLGVGCGFFFPDSVSRLFITFNGLFGNFLGFIIPLLIVGLIVPGIAEVGDRAGKLLSITAVVAYLFTLFSGFFTYGAASLLNPWLLSGNTLSSIESSSEVLAPYFTIEIAPMFGVMSALILSFVIGIGITAIKGERLGEVFNELRDIILLCIDKIIIPLLPIYIFGIFLSMTISGQVAGVLAVFVKVILMVFLLTAILLVVQFSIAGAISKRNPFVMLRNMMSAYVTALGTQSSAATIPVTLAQTIKNGVRPSIAGFVIPLCATIHLSGSTMKIVACALAIMTLSGMDVDFATMSGFIMMLGVIMIAAPGVPGGAIMAALGALESMLGFNDQALALMIALYIAMDSFGTATNVTGDGAIAAIIDTIADKKL